MFRPMITLRNTLGICVQSVPNVVELGIVACLSFEP